MSEEKCVAIIGTRWPHKDKKGQLVEGLESSTFDMLTRLSFWLCSQGHTIVTGGAEGADHAGMLGARMFCDVFERHLNETLTVYLPWASYNKELVPANANIIVGGWDEEDLRLANLHPYYDNLGGGKPLMNRNAQIVRAADIVVAHPRLDGQGKSTGGTDHGIKCALDLGRGLILTTDPKKVAALEKKMKGGE